MLFDDWKLKWGQPNPEPLMSNFIRKPTSGIQTKTGAMQILQDAYVDDDGSGYHPGEESGYGITSFNPDIDGSGWAWTNDPMANKNRYKPRTFDNVGYQRALSRWEKLEDEKAKQQAIFQDMAMGTPQQATSAATGRFGGGGNSFEIEPQNVSAMSKNSMAQLSDFNVSDYPFLKKWRNV